MEIVNNQK